MGKTRNLNGEKTKISTLNRNGEKKSTKRPISTFFRFYRPNHEFLDDPSVRKMKSDSRTTLFIPRLRKHKNTHHEMDNGLSKREITTSQISALQKNNSVSVSTNDNLHLSGSTCSSVSSLDTLISVDSGVDCGSNSTSSLDSVESFTNIMTGKDSMPQGRAPIASPEDDILLEENVLKNKHKSDSDLGNITIPHNTSISSLCTGSDNHSNSVCSSYDTDSSESESEDSLQRTPVQSDSESDSEDVRKSRRRRRRSYSDSDSDSDFDESCDFFSMSQSMNSSTLNMKEKSKSKKLSRSTSKLNLSFKKLVRSGSKLDLSLKKLIRGSSKSNLKGKQKSDSNVSIPQLKESPRKVLPRKPPSGKKGLSKVKSSKMPPSNKSLKNNSLSSVRGFSADSLNSSNLGAGNNFQRSKNFQNISMDSLSVCDHLSQSDSDSGSSFHGSSVSNSSSSDGIYSSSFRVPNSGRSGIKLGNRVQKLKRSKSECSSRQRPVVNKRTNLFSNHDDASCNVRQLLSNSGHDGGSRTVRQVLNNSPSLKVRTQCFTGSPYEIDIDTCKSPAEVRQAMEKTAFWIENNDYDKTPDVSSTESLLQTNQDVTETDLCNQIIGIYFGEENDSDSSLSSSCLDGSLDTSLVPDDKTSPVMSTPLETNLDDFTVAKFVPATSKTAEAKTRKIVQENFKEMKLVCADSQKENCVKLRSHKKKVSSQSSRAQHHHKKKFLNEDEIDTITKIHTICNGQRAAQYLNMNDIPLNFNHYPPPKRPSKVEWDQDLYTDEYIHHTPPSKISQPRPILQQKPKDFTYPYQEDEPSPIVITKLRRSKSLPRKSREWPW